MAKLKFKVSGQFETIGFQFYPDNYQENFFQPKEVESKKEMQSLIASNARADWFLGLRTHDGSKSHFKLALKLSANEGNQFSIEPSSDGRGIIATVDGNFWADVDDDDTLKQLKKTLKNGTAKFSIVEIFMAREEITMKPFGQEGGTLKGIDWDDYPSMPQAVLIENDIVGAAAKPTKTKIPTELLLPIKTTIEKALAPEELTSTQAALDEGIQLNLGLSIPGGSNEIIIKPSDFDGKFTAKIVNKKLKIAIDANVRFKIDSWIKKHANQAPFDITLSSYWDADGSKVFLGDIDPKTGFSADVVVGKIDMPQ